MNIVLYIALMIIIPIFIVIVGALLSYRTKRFYLVVFAISFILAVCFMGLWWANEDNITEPLSVESTEIVSCTITDSNRITVTSVDNEESTYFLNEITFKINNNVSMLTIEKRLTYTKITILTSEENIEKIKGYKTIKLN